MSRRVKLAMLVALSVVALGVVVVGAAVFLLTRSDGDERAASDVTAPVTASPPTAAATTIPTTSGSASGATTTTTIGRRGSGQPVTIAFAGDTHFEGVLRSQLAANPPGVLGPIAPALSGADLTVVNLETAITDRGDAQDKEFTFRTNPSALTALTGAGVDVVSMANNHGMDFGLVGLLDSIAAGRAAGFPIVGIGNNAAEAYAPYRSEIKGQRIAVIGATQVLDAHLIASWSATDSQPGLASAKDVPRLLAAVAEARATSDTVVVFLHWGIEGQTCPSAAQQELAGQLVFAGADIIVGGHAHRLQGAGRFGDALVAYGLGNFVFYARPGEGARTGVLTVTVTGRDIDAYAWAPAEIRAGVPQLLAGDDAAAALQQWDGLRGCTGLAP